MAITYPRTLPTPFPWRDCKFLQNYQQVRAPTRGGLVQVANIGREFWTMRYQTAPIPELRVAEFEAWLASLRGGARLFRASHPLREFPVDYPNGFSGLTVSGSPFSGSGNLSSVNGTLDVITITALPSAFQFRAGDMLSFPYASGAKQSLHRVLEDVAASVAASATAAVTVEPTVPPNFATSQPILLTNAWCHGVLDPASVDIAWQLGRKAVVSFSAAQVH